MSSPHTNSTQPAVHCCGAPPRYTPTGHPLVYTQRQGCRGDDPYTLMQPPLNTRQIKQHSHPCGFAQPLVTAASCQNDGAKKPNQHNARNGSVGIASTKHTLTQTPATKQQMVPVASGNSKSAACLAVVHWVALDGWENNYT